MTKQAATKDDCEKAVKMNKDGKKMPEILRMTGLSYSQAWGAIEAAGLAKADLVPEAQRTPKTAAQMRDQKQISWGRIMILFGWHPSEALCGRMADGSKVTEGRIRKGYTDITGTASEGLRIGRGGAFLLGDEGIVLYRGGHRQKTGMEIDATLSRGQIIAQVEKGIDERMTRLVNDGKITRAEADKRAAASKARAAKIVDGQKAKPNGVVKKAARKAPAKKVASVVKKQRPSKKAVGAMKKATAGQAAAEARMAAREAASVGAE